MSDIEKPEEIEEISTIVKSFLPKLSESSIMKYLEKHKKISEIDDGEDGDEELDEEDDDFDEDNMKFNIVIAVDNIPGLSSLYEEYDEDDSDGSYTTVEEYDEEVDSNYVLPVTRSRRKKQNIDTQKDKSTADNNEIKDEEVEEKSILTEMIEAKAKGADYFNKYCEKMVADEEDKIKKEQERVRKIEEKKETTKNTKEYRKLLKNKMIGSDFKYFSKMPVEEQRKTLENIKQINSIINIDAPYKISLINSVVPDKIKSIALKKITSLENIEPSSGEFNKMKQWVDTFMKIPFGIYSELPVLLESSSSKEIQNYMKESIETLDNVVFGMNDAKYQFLQILGQWISNPSSIGNAIAIKGPMGTGKTTLVKEGISKILNRPFSFIALGGASDSSFLEGHSYTYEGSTWGQIVDILIQSKCMNPVIYFDELDKISDTPKGDEITGILTHLTDSTQNDQFHDKYFSGIDFDLSRVLFIFSYNDESKINPILRDRMYRIETNGYSLQEKNIIANKYLLPKITKNISLQGEDVTIEDGILEYINSSYSNEEKGVRNFKRNLEIIYNKINLYRLLEPNTKIFGDENSMEIKLPFNVTKDIVDKFLNKSSSSVPFGMYT
jgi:ATP-dependent Lon protease